MFVSVRVYRDVRWIGGQEWEEEAVDMMSGRGTYGNIDLVLLVWIHGELLRGGRGSVFWLFCCGFEGEWVEKVVK